VEGLRTGLPDYAETAVLASLLRKRFYSGQRKISMRGNAHDGEDDGSRIRGQPADNG
jgi:hypothetical protein